MNFMQQVKRMALCCSILQIYQRGFWRLSRSAAVQIPSVHNHVPAGMLPNLGNDGLPPLFS